MPQPVIVVKIVGNRSGSHPGNLVSPRIITGVELVENLHAEAGVRGRLIVGLIIGDVGFRSNGLIPFNAVACFEINQKAHNSCRIRSRVPTGVTDNDIIIGFAGLIICHGQRLHRIGAVLIGVCGLNCIGLAVDNQVGLLLRSVRVRLPLLPNLFVVFAVAHHILQINIIGNEESACL